MSRSTRISTICRRRSAPRFRQHQDRSKKPWTRSRAITQFLLKGDVFTKDVVETHLSYKRSRELDEIRLRPHPYEFLLYYDV